MTAQVVAEAAESSLASSATEKSEAGRPVARESARATASELESGVRGVPMALALALALALLLAPALELKLAPTPSTRSAQLR